MTRLGAVTRLVRTPAAHSGRDLPLPRTPTGRLASQPPESGECRLIRIEAVHRVSRQPTGLAGRRLEEGRLVVGNRCSSKNRNFPDESTILAP